jgi:hypothetical protein
MIARQPESRIMNSTARVAMVALGSAFYLGLAILGWGG